jgi:glutathione S-transferase
VILHGYWRSGTSYRTRIALNLKGLTYAQAGVDLRTGAQRSDAFRALNPQGLVPALEVGASGWKRPSRPRRCCRRRRWTGRRSGPWRP